MGRAGLEGLQLAALMGLRLQRGPQSSVGRAPKYGGRRVSTGGVEWDGRELGSHHSKKILCLAISTGVQGVVELGSPQWEVVEVACGGQWPLLMRCRAQQGESSWNLSLQRCLEGLDF